ncbi:MAG: hypothetical protein MJ159_01645 [Treponemataceae bacterium]|nr:hypothetical protein [Treponemataceae bacterium]
MKNSKQNKTSAILFIICTLIWALVGVLDFIDKGFSVKFFLDAFCFVMFLICSITYTKLAKKDKKDSE